MARLLYSRYWQTTQRLLPIIVLALYVMSILVTALLFSWLADQFVRYALACVVVQTVSLLLLTAGLVAGKIIETRWNDRRRRRSLHRRCCLRRDRRRLLLRQRRSLLRRRVRFLLR